MWWQLFVVSTWDLLALNEVYSRLWHLRIRILVPLLYTAASYCVFCSLAISL